MRVLVLGGTGSIGSHVLHELAQQAHEIVALARSETSARRIVELGGKPLAGDIGTPEQWAGALPPLDAVVHMACDFDSPMGDVEQRLLDGLLPHLAAQGQKAKFIYTGGGWLLGASGDTVATETTPFRPLPAFAWMVRSLQRVIDAEGIDPMVIHPAMAYDASGGVLRRFIDDAIGRDAIRVVGSESVRWPLVHCRDLAKLYALALEGGVARESYIGAAIAGLPVGAIARAVERRFGSGDRAPRIISADTAAAQLGEWARGYAMDQQLSGEKARRDLGWRPTHLDPLSDIASMHSPMT